MRRLLSRRGLFLAVPMMVLLASLIVSVEGRSQPAVKGTGVSESVKSFVENKSLAGAVMLVANKDKVLTQEAVGYLDIGAMLMMPLNAIFWIASMTKPITAVALMMLVDEGKVRLDDPVEKYLPEFKGQMMKVGKDKLAAPKRAITVRDLLTHTSGLPGKISVETPTLDLLTLKDAGERYGKTPLEFEPGTSFIYSNPGINTLGRIIEVTSGMSYEDFMDKRLFHPLGMKDTTFWPSAEQMKRLAKSYKPNAAKDGLETTQIWALKYPLDDRKRQPMPAGGLFSTAQDVGVFCQMVLNNGEHKGKRYISESAVKEMTMRQTPKELKQSWGLGFTANDGVYGHGGAFATNMSVDSKRGLITVWMVQHNGFPKDGGKAQGAFRSAAEKLFSK